MGEEKTFVDVLFPMAFPFSSHHCIEKQHTLIPDCDVQLFWIFSLGAVQFLSFSCRSADHPMLSAIKKKKGFGFSCIYSQMTNL